MFSRLRRGDYDHETDGAELERQLDNRGVLNRFLGRFTKSITKSWHSYPVGLLFGLGFDTATEIALLVLAGTSAAAGLPWYAILCLPVLFTAGMCLLDTVDGSFMNFAYGWAFSNPVRKIYYNITVTALSVAVALLIGSVELLTLFAEQFGWRARSGAGSAGWTWAPSAISWWAPSSSPGRWPCSSGATAASNRSGLPPERVPEQCCAFGAFGCRTVLMSLGRTPVIGGA